MGEKNRFDFEKTVKYTLSAIDYMGLVVWSAITKVSGSVQKSTPFMGGRSTRSSASLRKQSSREHSNRREICSNQKTNKKKAKTQSNQKNKSNRKTSFLSAKANKEKMSALEASISEFEKRLISLEKRGVNISESTVEKPREKRKLNEEKRAVLRMLVDEQKKLKELTQS